ncbi:MULTISPECIES: J domain-containing protein [Halococcus]|uniref:Heat shock protein DnaJ domain-containing protein n=1 Tax=Halococcus salifodinae DSM 8989 TaxID=1227456 RepID=M0N0D5_9EURY|nr:MULTISPECIES: J domain-containing protein [Halococcus]EMA50130.1 heat shock protein DnaJ domain-containing protein [Halococcus salifodinae DSM 8989]
MFEEVTAPLSEWLVLGGALALASLVVVASVFVVGARLFPTTVQSSTRLTGERKRRREIREYLRSIDEPFAEEHPVCGQSVAFYLPKRDVAITFDARAYYRIQRAATDAVLVEHELPGVHLGSRLPFDTPDLALDEGTGVDPASAAFGVLGLPAGASVAEVKTAYREKVKQVHPDHGGDHEEFRRVREAYTTAKEHAG